jgi:hypothetical protein
MNPRDNLAGLRAAREELAREDVREERQAAILAPGSEDDIDYAKGLAPTVQKAPEPDFGARLKTAMTKLSDEKTKTDVEPSELRQKFDELGGAAAAHRRVGSHVYKYKPEFHGENGAGPGEKSGPMADELEHIPGVVEKGPDGIKRVDTGRLALSGASAVGQVVRKQDETDRTVDELRRAIEELKGAA